MAKSKKKKSNTIVANFKGVKTIKVPTDGDYVLKVVEAEIAESSSGNPMIKLECEVAKGEFEGSKVWHNLAFAETALWKTKEALEAMGIDVPDDEYEIDPSELVDSEFGATLARETYEGTTRAKIAHFLSADEVESEDDDEDEDDEKPKKGSKKKEELDVSEMDEDELAEVIEDKGLDIDLDDYSSIKKKRAAVSEALEGNEEEEKDSDETTYSEDQIDEMDSEELEALNNDLELDIDDLEDMSKKAAKKAVLKALKKKGLLED